LSTWTFLDYEFEDYASIYKSYRQSASLRETKAKRKEQRCRVYELKVNNAKLNSTQRNHLDMIFVEAKWIYNDIIKDVSNKATDAYVRSLKEVAVRYPDGFSYQTISHISSQMKQSIATGVISSLKSLAKLKANGQEVGELKFVSEYRSVDLKQYGNTYRIDFAKKTIKLQGLGKPLKVFGLEQIACNADIANAKLVKRFGEYYFYITTYSKDERVRKNEVLGLDFGISENLIMSNNMELTYKTPISPRTIKLQQSLSRKIGAKKGEKKSKKYLKNKRALTKSHYTDRMRRRDANNKIFHFIDGYNKIAMQDEQIKGWMGSKEANKAIQYSAMGTIKSKLSGLESSRIEVLDKFKATTKTCSCCGAIRRMSKKDRVYKCLKCGLTIDRNLNSTFNMINMSRFATEYSKTMPVDSSNKDFINLSNIEGLEIRILSREAR
jgi:probable transposase